MIKPAIQITIVYDSKGEECEAHCGLDWASKKTIALATQRVKDRFGDKARLEYLDMSKPSTARHDLKLSQEVRDKNLPLPSLLINGETRISGQFDMRLLLDVIEAEMEMESH